MTGRLSTPAAQRQRWRDGRTRHLTDRPAAGRPHPRPHHRPTAHRPPGATRPARPAPAAPGRPNVPGPQPVGGPRPRRSARRRCRSPSSLYGRARRRLYCRAGAPVAASHYSVGLRRRTRVERRATSERASGGGEVPSRRPPPAGPSASIQRRTAPCRATASALGPSLAPPSRAESSEMNGTRRRRRRAPAERRASRPSANSICRVAIGGGRAPPPGTAPDALSLGTEQGRCSAAVGGWRWWRCGTEINTAGKQSAWRTLLAAGHRLMSGLDGNRPAADDVGGGGGGGVDGRRVSTPPCPPSGQVGRRPPRRQLGSSGCVGATRWAASSADHKGGRRPPPHRGRGGAPLGRPAPPRTVLHSCRRGTSAGGGGGGGGGGGCSVRRARPWTAPTAGTAARVRSARLRLASLVSVHLGWAPLSSLSRLKASPAETKS